MNTRLIPAFFLLIALFCVSSSLEAQTEYVTIGTAGITGVYYPTGTAIAGVINRKKEEYDIQAMVEATPGSVFNIHAVIAGDMEFAIVQSDSQYQALMGAAQWKEKGPQAELRSVFSLYPEIVTLIAATDAGIDNLHDLKGKRVNIGAPGSGHRQNAIDTLLAAGIDPEKNLRIESFNASEAPALLEEGRIDAFFFTAGHPSAIIQEATRGTRPVRFASIGEIKPLLARYPFFGKSLIPVDQYPEARNKEMVESVAVLATLVTSARVTDKLVYAMTKEVFENIEELKEKHPALRALDRKRMAQVLPAPLHPGALRYYRESGLLR